MAYQKPKDHSKQTLKKEIAKSKQSGGKLDDRYSVAALRKNASTGGGEPIPKGQKMTTEKRVKQPRDPVTQQFTYNADADWELEYSSRGKGIPLAARRLGINADAFKYEGNKAAISDKVWLTLDGKDIDKEAVIDAFRYYSEEAKDYITEEGTAFSEGYGRKRGRVSAKEKKEMGEKQFRLSKDLGNVNAGKAQQSMNEQAKKYARTNLNAKLVKATISPEKLAKNKAFNEKAKNQYKLFQPKPKTQPKPQTQPNPQPQPQPEEEPENEGLDYSQAKADPAKFYQENKEQVDAEAKEFNEVTGLNLTAEEFIDTVINSMN